MSMDAAIENLDHLKRQRTARARRGMRLRCARPYRSRGATRSFVAIGRRLSLTDQEGATTSFQYNPRDLVTKITDPLLKETTLTYDNAGRQNLITDRNGDTVDFAYTPSGKVKTITATDVSTAAVSTVAFTYTPDWEDLATTSGHGIFSYKAYRADNDPSGTFFCVNESVAPRFADPEIPLLEEVFFYVVTATNSSGEETNAGPRSDGTLRELSTQACP